MRQIFDSHAAFLWRALRHLGIPERDVEDVCQEVFIVVHRKLPSFEGRSALRTWLYGICLRIARDYRQSARVRREIVVADPPDRITEPAQEDRLSYKDTKRLLRELLESLDDDKREVFVLYELEQLAMVEVADVVGCPVQTAYSRLHAARAIVLEAALALRRGPGR